MRLLDTRCGVCMLQPGLTSACVAVQSMVQVCLSRPLNFRFNSTGFAASLPMGKNWEEGFADHISTASRRALRRSMEDSTVPASVTPARTISVFMGEPPWVPYRLSLNLPENSGPRPCWRRAGVFSAQAIPAWRQPSCDAAQAGTCEPRVLLQFRRRAWFPAHRSRS